ncbi:MAG: hypothetical protein HY897_06805 [Deltaproteobacteria bacterium]|nr:hypothetical protein [Deltaproteobacteria bacterium]
MVITAPEEEALCVPSQRQVIVCLPAARGLLEYTATSSVRILAYRSTTTSVAPSMVTPICP